MQRIGMRLDHAVHLAVSRALVLALPFLVCDGVDRLVGALTADDGPGYMVWLIAASLSEIWARTSAVCVLRGAPISRALGAALRRPGTFVLYTAFAWIELWADPFDTDLGGIALALVVSLAVFASMLALTDTFSENVLPLRALAFWLREVCRPSRIGVNLVGALTVNLLMYGVTGVLYDLPLPHWPVVRAAFVVPEALADTIAMVFVVLWRDAFLDERRGRDLEVMLAVQGRVTASPRASSPGSITSQ
jgi:hypothetical protein